MGQVQQVKTFLADPFEAFVSLTENERRVLRLASRALPNRVIGDRMGMSLPMVAYTLRSGLLKIGLKKADLGDWAFTQIEKMLE